MHCTCMLKIITGHNASIKRKSQGERQGEEGTQEGLPGEQGQRVLRRPPRPRGPLPLPHCVRLHQNQA